jgi:hypothetical protein
MMTRGSTVQALQQDWRLYADMLEKICTENTRWLV